MFLWDCRWRRKKAADLGFVGSYLPAEYGGADSDLFAKAIIYEEFVRACSQAGLDSQWMASLCQRDARYDVDQAEDLCRTLQWLIEDEQANAMATGEIDILNRSSSVESMSRAQMAYYGFKPDRNFARPNWPITIEQTDNGLPDAGWTLPEGPFLARCRVLRF